MSTENTMWLALIWKALAEIDPARKDLLLKRAQTLIEHQPRAAKSRL
jgi:hypothetical protein